MVGICETWLLPEVSSSLIEVPGFSLIRNDTTSGRRKHGVCIYLHNNLRLGSVYADHPNTVGVFLPHFGIHLLVVYRPPSNTPELDRDLISYLYDFCLGREVCLMGDFNLPTVDWNFDPPISSSSHDDNFLDCFLSLGLTQHILQTTFIPSGRTLDLVLTSDPEIITHTSILSPLPGCGHCPISFSCAFDDPQLDNSEPKTHKLDWF